MSSRTRVALAAAAALIGIGSLEAMESARQIAETAGPLRLRPGGVGLTALGVVASAAIYLGVGWIARSERDAVRMGLLCGGVAGVVGGIIRANIVAPAVSDIVARYAVVPDWFLIVVMGVFVAGCIAVSVIAGAALAFAGSRFSRGGRTRPPA
jgi:uncharacterized protein (UPF0264 family)